MRVLLFAVTLVLAACASAPEIIQGKGNIYGTLSADVHPLWAKKQQNIGAANAIYGESDMDKALFKDNMVNYDKLDELYVGLIQSNYVPRQHRLMVTVNGMSSRSLALAPGDMVQMVNHTAQSHHFYLVKADSANDQIQTCPVLEPGATVSFLVEMEGNLVLQSEDNEQLQVAFLSQKNLLTQRVSSGNQYQFNQLEPGYHQLIFWFWRLGKIQKSVMVSANQNTRVDKVLTVDSVLRNQ